MKLIIITAEGRTECHKVTEGQPHLHMVTVPWLGDTVTKGTFWSYKLRGIWRGLLESVLEAAEKWCVSCVFLLFAFQFPSRNIFVLLLRWQSPRSDSPFFSCNGFSRSSFQVNSLWINQGYIRHLLWVQLWAGECEGERELGSETQSIFKLHDS